MTRFRSKTAATATLGLLALALTACGGSADEGAPAITPTDAQTVSLDGYDLITFKFPVGLSCDAYDGYDGGGIDCNFDAFTVPTNWQPGIISTMGVAGDEVYLNYYADGHYCVTFSGYRNGDVRCSYPEANPRR